MDEVNIVKEFYAGNTRIKIAGNYIKEAAEVKIILNQVAVQAQRAFYTYAEKKTNSDEFLNTIKTDPAFEKKTEESV